MSTKWTVALLDCSRILIDLAEYDLGTNCCMQSHMGVVASYCTGSAPACFGEKNVAIKP